MSAPLNRSATTVVGADGTATIEVGPASAWESWRVRRVVVSLSTGTGLAATYRNVVGDASRIDATSRGDSDVAEYIDPLALPSGDRIVVRWFQAEPGATATVAITGEVGR